MGLLVLWVLGLLLDATVWLTWTVGVLALAPIGIVGLVPGAGTARPAGVCLLLTAAALLSIVVAALGREATPWLTWLSLAFAGLSFTAALDALAQGPFERLRVPPTV
jgi:hypothetical protein